MKTKTSVNEINKGNMEEFAFVFKRRGRSVWESLLTIIGDRSNLGKVKKKKFR